MDATDTIINEAVAAGAALSTPVTDEQAQRAMSAMLKLIPVLNRWQGEDYTHIFAKPFMFKEVSYDMLTFHWGVLTGKDHLEIGAELRMRGIAFRPETHQYPAEYLVGMAVRACKDADGKNVLDSTAFNSMSFQDCSRILAMARNFLTAAGL